MVHQVSVNINNLRKQSLHRLDSLVDKLNKAIDDGHISIQAEDIKEELDDLRMLLGTMASCYYEGDNDFIDVYSEVYPDKDDSMKLFYNIEL